MEPRDDLVYKFIQLFIGLATGVLTISVSIITNRFGCPSFPYLLILIWVLLVVSIILGIFAHSSMIGLYDLIQRKENSKEIEMRRILGRRISSCQFWIASVGLAGFFIYGVLVCLNL